MKYYVVADIHGFYREFIEAINDKGFFNDTELHKLIICGDLFDRGEEALELQKFIVDLQKKDEVILIRGNHDDLAEELVDNVDKWMTMNVIGTHHWSNGTVSTLLNLIKMDLMDAVLQNKKFALKAKTTPFFKTILPAMQDYYETKNYIFVHGWIPCGVLGRGNNPSDVFMYESDWRMQDKFKWERARWINGMLAASKGVVEPNKTIVCGHWHCSYGHAKLEGKGTEFDSDADFSPYYGNGVIALDACTAFSGKVNCIVLNDEPI